MQRSVTILGLIASVGLLLAVFAFALKNPELFIDDLNGTHSDSTSTNADVVTSSGAKISGAVVGSQETQMRESAKIRDVELDALQNEQWLQQVGPAATNNESSSLDDAFDFAPERPTDVVNLIDSAQENLKHNDSSSELDNESPATIGSIPEDNEDLTQRALQELQGMSFSDIRFQFGQLTLSDKALQKIDSVASILKSNPSINAQINNYTDSYGDNNFNLELSRQRANTVYEAFLDRGVSKRQLSFEGLGESNPVTSNATLAGRKKNRRTEIQFFEAN